jgi:hypothetical protein
MPRTKCFSFVRIDFNLQKWGKIHTTENQPTWVQNNAFTFYFSYYIFSEFSNHVPFLKLQLRYRNLRIS